MKEKQKPENQRFKFDRIQWQLENMDKIRDKLGSVHEAVFVECAFLRRQSQPHNIPMP